MLVLSRPPLGKLLAELLKKKTCVSLRPGPKTQHEHSRRQSVRHESLGEVQVDNSPVGSGKLWSTGAMKGGTNVRRAGANSIDNWPIPEIAVAPVHPKTCATDRQPSCERTGRGPCSRCSPRWGGPHLTMQKQKTRDQETKGAWPPIESTRAGSKERCCRSANCWLGEWSRSQGVSPRPRRPWQGSLGLAGCSTLSDCPKNPRHISRSISHPT